MSSASYSVAGTINDPTALLSSILAVYPTALTLTNDNNLVVVTFSTALSAPQQTALTTLIQTYTDPIVPPRLRDTVATSSANSTSATLAANGTFTGAWEDVSAYTSVSVVASSPQGSALNGVIGQFGVSSARVDGTKTFTLAAGATSAFPMPVTGRYFRLVYTNGAVAQTSLSIQTRYTTGQVTTVADQSTVVDDTTLTQVSRAIVTSRQDNGAYVVSRADEDRRTRVRVATDNAADTKGGFPLIQQGFGFSINPEAVSTTLTGAGTVTQALGCAVVSSAAAASTGALLTTRRYAAVGAGRVVRVLVACSFTAGVAGSTQLAGIGTAENGFFVGFNGASFGVMVRSFGVDTWTPQASFNVDGMAGAGPSAATLNPLVGNTYLITFDTTGYGSVSFSLASVSARVPSAVVMHRAAMTSTAQPGYRTVAAPLYAQAANSTNATAVTIRLASFSAFADAVPANIGTMRAVDYTRTVASTAYVPFFSVFNKATFNAYTNTTSMVPRRLSVACDGSKGSVIVGIFDSPTLTGSSYADVSTATSTVSVDSSASSMSGGVLLYSFCVSYNSDRQIDLGPLNIAVGPNNVLTVACRTSLSGTSYGLSASLCFGHDV